MRRFGLMVTILLTLLPWATLGNASCTMLTLVGGNSQFLDCATTNTAHCSLTPTVSPTYGTIHVRTDINPGGGGFCIPANSGGFELGGLDMYVGCYRSHGGGDHTTSNWICPAFHYSGYNIHGSFNYDITNTNSTAVNVCLGVQTGIWNLSTSSWSHGPFTYGDVCHTIEPGATETFTQGNPNAFTPVANMGHGAGAGAVPRTFFRAYVQTKPGMPWPAGLVLGGNGAIGNNYSSEPLW